MFSWLDFLEKGNQIFLYRPAFVELQHIFNLSFFTTPTDTFEQNVLPFMHTRVQRCCYILANEIFSCEFGFKVS
jgi:hypothetical protein